MKLVYEFTAAERRVVATAYQRYSEVLLTIAACHDLSNVVIAPDMSGFLRPESVVEGAKDGSNNNNGNN